MTFSQSARHQARFLLPVICCLVYAATVSVPQAMAEMASSTLDSLRLEARTAGDPFALRELLAEPGGNDLERALSTAWLNSVDAPGDTAPLTRWLKDSGEAPSEMRAFADLVLAQLYHLQGLYPQSAAAYAAAAEADPEGTTAETRDALELARIASSVDPIRVTGAAGAILDARVDMANLIRLPIAFQDSTASLIIDTGAEISVMAGSLARKIGARFLEGEVVVGSTTDDVTGRLALVDRMSIGAMSFHNVLFLVLPDEDLTFADGEYFVDGILGLQLFRMTGRMAWLDGGAHLAFGDSAPQVTGSGYPLFWHDSGLGIGLPFNGGLGPALLDSGASNTRFTSRLVDGMSEAQRAGITEEPFTRTGAGGEETIMIQRVPEIGIQLGGVTLRFKDAVVVPPESFAQDRQDLAVIGLSSIRQLSSFVIDFDSMSYEAVGAKD